MPSSMQGEMRYSEKIYNNFTMKSIHIFNSVQLKILLGLMWKYHISDDEMSRFHSSILNYFSPKQAWINLMPLRIFPNWDQISKNLFSPFLFVFLV